MKIYRCVIGGLLVLFIAFGVWYIVSHYNEQRSTNGGTLIQMQNEDWIQEMRGVGEDVSNDGLC